MLKQIFLISLIVFGSVFLIFYLFQRQLIYFPDKQKPVLSEYQAQDMTEISISTSDQIKLNAWYKSALNNKPTLLYLHGNAGHIGHRMPTVRTFINMGMGVLLLEYRGYGGNAGKPTESGLYIDARAALNFLAQKGVTGKQVVIYGESLGTGVATKIAEETSVCALILQSPFTSLTQIAHYHYPWIPVKPWDEFNSLERIKRINAPILVIHGKLDDIVPYEEGLKIYNAANKPKSMLSFDQYDHHDLRMGTNFNQEIISFILNNCPG
ncbi:MAG TPA: alpha/beta hydrolase [Legionella sp.]|nr:alpha/beta hydrolase [Legionella sp.]